METEKIETRGKKPDLAHEKFMRDKGIEVADLPEELQQANEILKEAKKEDFEAANEASKLIVEALQESIYEINDTIEKIGETLTDHEERLTELEKPLQEVKEENQEQQKQIEALQEQVEELQEQTELPAASETEMYSSKEEEILAKLFKENVGYITKPELKALGFNIGFFSKLTARGATYGGYKLEKAPSEKVYKVLKLM